MNERTTPNKGNPQQKPDDRGCKEKDNQTQKVVNTERTTYCTQLTLTSGDVYQWEENYAGLTELYGFKECLFIWTEENYQEYRNLEITIGTELIQSNETIKDNIANYIKANKTLADTLKDILKKVKDLKTKVYDLREMSGKLENCLYDSCNCSQLTVLTGKVAENCKDKGYQPTPNRPSACDNVDTIIDELLCMPKTLVTDVDTLFKASADVVGIQVFSNIGTLDALQKTLYDQSKAFDKFLQDTMKKGEGDLKKAQDDLVKTVQDLTKSKGTLYSKRSDFEGLFDAVAFFCCPACDCVKDGVNCEERLKTCGDDICQICDDVKNTFCSTPISTGQQAV